ncbi:S-adenosyl-L-methionine-dependent methyltransferase [Chytriomyces sp. MP71]|nr:S-adenosyl-L-methionine-dependent methyltransferase [Chytriomyces sp. MP71]
MALSSEIRALEFFCGIGGLHYGLNLALRQLRAEDASTQAEGKVLEAFDINHVTNRIYTHNFGHAPSQRAIEKLTATELDKMGADMWLLSPPCQPFTRGGKKLDDKDPRSRALLHLLDSLPHLRNPPRYLLLENVLNFEVSRSRDRLVRVLTRLGYDVQEWLLSPLQFGIPNDRKRYYLTAVRKRMTRAFRAGDTESDTMKGDSMGDKKSVDSTSVQERVATDEHLLEVQGADKDDEVSPLNLKTDWPFPVQDMEPVSSYLDANLVGQVGGATPHMPSSNDSAAATVFAAGRDGQECASVEALKIPEAFVKKRKFISDGYVVGPADKKSACFTKAYGHHGVGAGSFLQTKGFDLPKILDDPLAATEKYGLRFFSPNEVARLHGFPVKDGVTSKSQGENRNDKEDQREGFDLQGQVKEGEGASVRLDGDFSFPPDTTLIQRYRVLGNSLNVVVVAGLLRHILLKE